MKRISLLVLLVALVLSTIVACSGGKEDAVTTDGITDADTETSETTALPGILDADGNVVTDSELHGWFDYGSALYMRDAGKFKMGTRTSIGITMAKNEMEGFQYVLVSNVDHADLRCEVSELTDGNGNTLSGTVYLAYNTLISKADYYHDRGHTPDALLEQENPYWGGSFDLKSGRSQTIYVKYTTDANTVPGVYTGTLQIKQGDTVVKEGPVSVTVWNIYYDEATACETFFINKDTNTSMYPEGAPILDGRDAELLKLYCDFLIENRLSAVNLPCRIDNKAALEYLNNPRVTSIYVSQTEMNITPPAKLQQLATEHPEWGEKFKVYNWDEPGNEDHVQRILAWSAPLYAKYPLVHNMPPLVGNLPDENGTNIIERLAPYTDTFCVNLPMFMGEIRESMLKYKEERGDTLYWYVCNKGKDDTLHLLACLPGTEKRVLFWQQYQNNIDGFLYWHTVYWASVGNIWEEGYAEKEPLPIFGDAMSTTDGVLLYWDPLTKEPLGTLGLESVRDGVEDFQLLTMAEEVLGKEVAMTYAERITTSIYDYCQDAEELQQVRNELAAALMAGKNP